MKNILVAVSGLTPQVISETLYCLAVQRKTKIDEIYVITTTEGKRNIEEYYFLNRKTNKREGPYSLKEEIDRMCTKHKIEKPIFNIRQNVIAATEENVKLHDVKTDRENKLFPNAITKLIKHLSEDERSILYCSLSGGRKTMSAYMGFALSLYAREGDMLFHVLASKEFEATGKFYPERKNNKDLVLSEVPFIRLRPLLRDKTEYKNITYTEIIEKTQEELESIREDGIIIDINKCLISYRSKKLKIPPIQLALYLFFVEHKRKGNSSINIRELDKENSSYVEEIYRIYLQITGKTKKEYEETFTPEELRNKWFRFGITKEKFLHDKSKINDKIEMLFDEETSWLAENFYIVKAAAHGHSEYTIIAPTERFKIIHSVNELKAGTS